MKPCKCVPDVLERISQFSHPKALSMQTKGPWKDYSTVEMLKNIQRISYGLLSFGHRKGDYIGILSIPSPNWTMVDLAIMNIGAVSVPLFPNLSEENFIFEVSQTNIKTVFVGSSQAWEMVNRHSHLFKNIISLDEEDSPADVMTVEELMKKGDEFAKGHQDAIKIDIHPDDIATIIYTSGSTGTPKGVVLSQRAITALVEFDGFKWDPEKDLYLSILPLAHVFGRVLNMCIVGNGVSVAYLQDIKTLGKVCQEIHPTLLVVVPRLLEKIYAKMLASVQNAGFMKRTIGMWAFDLANDEEEHLYRHMLHPVYDKVVYSVLREAFGGKLRLMICGGASLNPHLGHFFLEIGVPVYQGWGLTEACPVTCNFPGKNKIGTVGKTVLDIQVKVENGELLVKGPVSMREYYKNPSATEKILTEDGWVKTGDLGKIDEDGYVTIIGRSKEMFKTSTGEYVVPIPIEQAICKAPLIDMAIIIAEGRKYVTCLLFPDFDVLASLKAAHGATSISDEEFLKSDFIRQEMKQLFDSINERLNKWERILDYRFITHHLTIDGGELTPSMKVKRDVVEKKFADVINSMYEAGVLSAQTSEA